jgi:nucleoside-diphosphate-sugar epimerase
MNISDKIFVAGHKGLVGSALVRELSKRGYTNILTVDKNIVDLKDQKSVNKFHHLLFPMNRVFFLGEQCAQRYLN